LKENLQKRICKGQNTGFDGSFIHQIAPPGGGAVCIGVALGLIGFTNFERL